MKRLAIIILSMTVSLTGFAQSKHTTTLQNTQPDTAAVWKFTIREAKVSASKIEERGDTLQYIVGGFKQRQDRSIEDVISRMPGLEVGANGTIKYEGKAISKFYIEGMDLMGSGYAMASRNLSADNVRRVEVLRNHQHIRSLRGKSFSDQAALNIVLKDEVRNSWSGTADLGLGTRLHKESEPGKEPNLQYDSRLMTMLFGRKAQNLSLFKANSTGTDIGAETLDLAALMRSVYSERGIIDMDAISTPDLDPARIRFNRSQLAAINQLFLTPRGSNIRMQLNWLNDRTAMIESRQTLYNGINDTSISEESRLHARTHRLKGELQYTVNNDALYIDNRLRGYADWNGSEGSTVLGGVSTARFVQPRRRYVQEDFHLIRPFSGNKKIEVSSQTTFSYLPGKILTVGEIPESLNLSSLQSHSYAAFNHRIRKINMRWKAGVRAESKRLHVAIEGADFDGQFSDFSAYFTPELEFNRQWFKAKVGIGIDYDATRLLHNTLDFSLNDAPTYYTDLAILPDLSLQWILVPGLTLHTGASRNRNKEPLTAIAPALIYTGYRTRTEGLGRSVFGLNNIAHIGLGYTDPIDGLFASITGTVYFTQRNILWETQLEGDTFVRRATPQTYNAPRFNLRTSFSKSFSWASARLSLTPQFTRSNFQNIAAGVLNSYSLDNLVVPFDWSLSTKWLSTEGRHQFIATRISGATDLYSFNHSMKLFIYPASGWQIGWQSEIYHSNDKSVSFNHFGDLSISYRAKRWEAGLRCNNIFDNDIYIRRSLSVIAETITINPLRAREIIAKISIDL